MKKFLCLALCLTLFVLTLSFVACSPFYTGEEIVNDQKQQVWDYFSNFDYSKMANYRVDTTRKATFANESDKNVNFQGYAIINQLQDCTLEFYELTYQSSVFSFKLKVWCDGTNCYFEETFPNGDGEMQTNKFFHSVEMDGYALNMQSIRQYFETLDVEEFCAYMSLGDLYGSGNAYRVSTIWDLAPTNLYVVLSEDSFRTKSELKIDTDEQNYFISTSMEKTLQNVTMPNLEGVAEGYLSDQLLDVLF